MSLDDIKKIDWQHFDLNKLPTYLTIGFAVVFIGIILLLIGILL